MKNKKENSVFRFKIKKMYDCINEMLNIDLLKNISKDLEGQEFGPTHQHRLKDIINKRIAALSLTNSHQTSLQNELKGNNNSTEYMGYFDMELIPPEENWLEDFIATVSSNAAVSSSKTVHIEDDTQYQAVDVQSQSEKISSLNQTIAESKSDMQLITQKDVDDFMQLVRTKSTSAEKKVAVKTKAWKKSPVLQA